MLGIQDTIKKKIIFSFFSVQYIRFPFDVEPPNDTRNDHISQQNSESRKEHQTTMTQTKHDIDVENEENKHTDTEKDKPQDISTAVNGPSMPRRRRASSISFEQFAESDDNEPLVEKQTELPSTASKIVDFMRKAWKLPVPNLIISVTGGARYFRIASPRMRNALQHGLIDAVMATGKIFI